MRRDFLKKYKITLTAIGPVFIGSGQETKKKEYIIDRGRQIAYILDEQKLFNYLIKRNLLDAYEKYMISDNRPLFAWVKDNGMQKDIPALAKYTLDCSAVADLNTVKNITMCIKDGYGKPYIPGSSVKGVLRNIILSKLASDNPDRELISEAVKQGRLELDRPDKRYMSRVSNSMNEMYFHTLNRPETKKKDAVNDVMSGIRISDSKPLSFDSLTICQKVDVNTDSKETNMPLVRECIKPDTVIELELTIDTTITDIDIDFIRKAVGDFLENYNKEFLCKFEEEELYHDNVIYLGGGAGYHSKTVTSTILQNEKNKVDITANIINNTIRPQDRNKHKHYNDKKLGVSPHIVKLTEYDGGLLQFGPCRIEFEEL